MTTKEHPHAEVLRAIADGVPLSEFEAMLIHEMWHPLDLVAFSNRDGDCGWCESGDKWKIRRKPQYIMVNGFKVPKPLDSSEGRNVVFVPRPDYPIMSDSYGARLGIERMVKLGIAHGTQDRAIAHAKAMLGIDPEYFK